MHFFKFILAAVAATTAIAHPGPDKVLGRAEIQRRSELSKRCAEHAVSFNKRRMTKRSAAQKRVEGTGRNTTYEITTEAPYYETFQNDTCVLTPEVTQGPYVWPRSQTLRQDMSENQPGIPLWLDVGVLDMETCEPLPNALLDFWHCNETGSYSSFTGLSPNIDFAVLLKEMKMNISDFEIGVTDVHTDDTTFLRGMWPTNKEGLMEIKTIFPGFYTGRSIHIHVQVHTDWHIRSNGTLIASNTVNTGQIYFEEKLSQKIMSVEPYASHTEVKRTTNAEDMVFDQDTKNGYNPVVNIVPVDGEDVTKGMIGYITIGVDTSMRSAPSSPL
ncbi:aromatic compound dioxygenase [Aspergillus avenaceus]|uniref:Aromatic compound dioxygenase n=1 Tax=Aspergillus avenaceus TaxID=36643 RepID=A0A5N6TMW6_ASPAV|nr:aromatic compound dioxygenase [Aspergillus avenaceus]